ncbi:terminase [Microbacterium phage EugeneKrabs]|nr:terminase [Microbacterium phage EugeneKrabs]
MTMTGNVFPRYYRPRPYQAELHEMWRSKRTGVAVYPRQSGKDVAMSMEAVDARLRRPKTNGVYIAPDAKSVRNILYDKSYWDPVAGVQVKMLQDNVPEGEVKWLNTMMTGQFKNKSLLKLEGYFESGKDSSGVGTSFDDYCITELSLFRREDPIPRLQPIIDGEQPNTRLMAVSTPRGKRNNPLWQLMQSMDGRKDFGLIIRTIDDLNEIMRRAGLPPVRTQEQLERTEETYLKRFGNARMFNQEYHVSFEEMDAAAVYGEALGRMIAERRTDAFNWNRNYPVYVAFDIGSSGKHSDATAWVAFQWFNEKLFIFDCGQGHGKALPEYVDVLQTKPWFGQLHQIILPWDALHHETAVRTTPADMMRLRFPNVAVLAKGSNIWQAKGLPDTDAADIITMVQSVRLQMYNTYINGLTDQERQAGRTERPNCDELLDCMENYKYSFDNKTGEYSPTPVHDKYSHLMDALRYVVQAIKELDFFGQLYSPNGGSTSRDYVQDYSEAYS